MNDEANKERPAAARTPMGIHQAARHERKAQEATGANVGGTEQGGSPNGGSTEFQQRAAQANQTIPLSETAPPSAQSEGANNPAMVDSASDLRMGNNTMRHQYRLLNDVEKSLMTEVKDIGLGFHNFLEHVAQATGEHSDGPNKGTAGSRELSIAKTKIEEAVMWAVKHITR